MNRPTVLDLYCGAGGAAMGYHQAGYDVLGVDNKPQPNYPFEFVQADALEYLAEHGRRFTLRHASPPCQASSALTKGTNAGRLYPQLIPATRELLEHSGGPFVIENVAGAPIRKDLRLCGEMFDLAVIRHRFFELSGFRVEAPEHRAHRGRVAGMRHGEWFTGCFFGEPGADTVSAAVISAVVGLVLACAVVPFAWRAGLRRAERTATKARQS